MKDVGENARSAADLYWNDPFGTVCWRRAERAVLSGSQPAIRRRPACTDSAGV